MKETAVGSSRQFLRAPTATLDELEIHVTTLNPGQTSHAPHQHANEELLIMKEGTVEALVNGERKRVEHGLGDLPGHQPAARHQERRHRAGHLPRRQLELAGDAGEETPAVAQGFGPAVLKR